MLKTIKPALVLFLTCFIVTGLLAMTYSATKDTISELEEKTQQEAREQVMSEATVFTKMDISEFGEDSVTKVFMGKDADGKTVGTVVSVEPKGYGGKIKLSIGIKADGTIEGVAIIEHLETPGLGAKMTEEPFISQFKELTTNDELVVIKKAKTTSNEIEAISGATISSKAVTEGVKTAKKISMEIMDKAGDA